MPFLPQGYVAPSSGSNYLKLAKGDNRFRILGSAIVGWIDWTADKKPIRARTPMIPIDPTKPVKHFWAFPVWDYTSKSIKILEITQRTIQTAIEGLSLDTDWGDVLQYDICVKRTGDGMETEYTVVPVPPKPLHPEIARLYGESKIDLEALFDGKDPFAGGGTTTTSAPDNSDVREDEIDASSIPF